MSAENSCLVENSNRVGLPPELPPPPEFLENVNWEGMLNREVLIELVRAYPMISRVAFLH